MYEKNSTYQEPAKELIQPTAHRPLFTDYQDLVCDDLESIMETQEAILGKFDDIIQYQQISIIKTDAVLFFLAIIIILSVLRQMLRRSNNG